MRRVRPRFRVAALTSLLLLASGFAYTIQPDPVPEPTPAPTQIFVDGIPRLDYHDERGVQDNPWHVASWAIRSPENLQAGADWLIQTQHPDGSWRYEFDHLASGQVQLEAGWPSALAQGGAIRVLAAEYERTGDPEALEAASAAIDFLNVRVEDGGVRTTLGDDVWFEEYPTDPPSFVLNGFLFLLEGLWDARATVPGAADLYEEGRATIERHIGRWDTDGHVAYDLFHESLDIDPWWLLDYDSIHQRLLRVLLDHRPSAEIQYWYDKWFPDANS